MCIRDRRFFAERNTTLSAYFFLLIDNAITQIATNATTVETMKMALGASASGCRMTPMAISVAQIARKTNSKKIGFLDACWLSSGISAIPKSRWLF